MKNNKNVRKDNLSPVENGSKRIYKMYKSKKNWVVAPVVLLTLLGAVAPAPIALTNVVSAAETTDLSDFAKDAINKINALPATELTNAEKQAKIDTIQGDATALTALKGAYTKVVTNLVDKLDTAATQAKNDVNTVKDKLVAPTTYTGAIEDAVKTVKDDTVTTDAYDVFVNGLGTGVTATTDNYATLRAAFDKVYNKAKTDIATQVSNAQAEATANASYDAKKADSLAKLAKLTNLNATQVADYTKQINAVKNNATPVVGSNNVAQYIVDFNGIIANATQANQDAVSNTLSAANDIITALADGDTKDALSGRYTKLYNNLTTTTLADAQKLLADAQAAKDAQDLTTAKNTAKTNIESATVTDETYTNDAEKLANLRADYKAKIDAAKDEDAIDSSVDAYKTEVTSLANIQQAAKGELTAQKLPNLSAVQLANYTYAVEHTTSKDAVTSILADAKAKDEKALTDAQASATTTINALTNISAEDKADALNSVKEAKKVSDVNTALDDAKTKDEDAKTAAELAAAKKAATDAIDTFTKSTTKVADKATIESKTTVADVNTAFTTILESYRDTITASTSLADAQTIAKEIIAVLPNLTDAEKAQAQKDALAAKTSDEVKATITSALTSDATNAKAKADAETLAKDKEEAIKTINGYTYLTDAQKADFVNKVNTAKDSAELTKVTSDAQTANSEAQDKAEAFQQKITNSIATVNDLSALTSVQKAEYNLKLLNAKTEEEADKIVLDAKAKDLEQTTEFDKTKNTSYQHKAKELITALENVGLSSEQAGAYRDAIDAATKLEDAKAILAEAKAVAAKQNDQELMKKIDDLLAAGYVNQAKAELAGLSDATNKATYTKKVADAEALVAAKAEAQKLIDEADYIPAKDKPSYVAKVNDAKSVDEVNKVLDEIKELAPATAVQLYRLYNPFSHEHLYTASKDEYDFLGSIGWQQEEFAWTAPSKGEEVYRLYNPFSGEHFYTMSTKEYNDLAKLGWKQEGLAFYSNSKDGNPLDNSVSIYRLYNPFEKGAGSHHFTTSTEERDHLVSLGWRAEGVGFFGLKK